MDDSLIIIWVASLGGLLLREIIRRYTGQDSQEKNRLAIAQEGKTVRTLQALLLKNGKIGSIIFDDSKKMYCFLRSETRDSHIQCISIPLYSMSALKRIHFIRYFLNNPQEYYKQLHEDTSAFVYDRMKVHPKIGPLAKKMNEKRIWTTTKLPFLDREKDQKTSDSLLDLLFPLAEDGGVNNLSGACHMAIRYTANGQDHLIVKPFTLSEINNLGKIVVAPGHMDPAKLLESYIETIKPFTQVVVDMCLAQQKTAKINPISEQ